MALLFCFALSSFGKNPSATLSALVGARFLQRVDERSSSSGAKFVQPRWQPDWKR